MSGLFREFGIGFSSETPIPTIIESARMAARAGAQKVWLGERYHSRSVIPIAALLLSQTDKIKVGIGIVSPYTRHPSVIAMEVAALDQISHGRVVLGLGAALTAIRTYGFNSKEHTPYSMHKECALMVRKLLSGEPFRYDGKNFAVAETIVGASPGISVPIYIGGISDSMLRLAGEIGDGLLLSYHATPEVVRHSRSMLQAGARSAGRNPDEIDLQAYFLMSVDEDAEAAEVPIKRFLMKFLPHISPTLLRSLGMSQQDLEPVLAAIKENDKEGALSSMDRRFIEKFSIVGTPEDCIDRLEEYSDTGLRGAIAYEVFGPDKLKSLGLLLNHVAPAVATI